MTRATEAERARLNETFAELCRIPSPSGHEAACAAYVEGELAAEGVDLEADERGNLLGCLGEPGEDRGVLLCAHLDTVAPAAPIEPVLEQDVWRNANAGILGADNKAAVAVLLELARRWARGAAPLPVELLFTVEEETGLTGAKAFDATRLRSPFGYVFDHASPIGEVITASPTDFRLEVDFHGRAAHAGLEPDRGRSAIVAAARAVAAFPQGRVDAETTANVGSIKGGSPTTNVVAERCRVEAEVRALERERGEAVVAELVDHVHDAANATECDVDVAVERRYEGYRLRRTALAVIAVEEALAECGFDPRPVSSGAASDANALRAQGFDCVNVANGTERAHQPDERVARVALEEMLDVTAAICEAAGQVQGAPTLSREAR